MKTQKHLLILFLVSVFLVSLAGCTVTRPRNHHPSKTVIVHPTPIGKIPPGQMKKMTGAKSAKHYAPGQVKKHSKHKKWK